MATSAAGDLRLTRIARRSCIEQLSSLATPLRANGVSQTSLRRHLPHVNVLFGNRVSGCPERVDDRAVDVDFGIAAGRRSSRNMEMRQFLGQSIADPVPRLNTHPETHGLW